MQQLPHITVATVVERGGKFLMVKERCKGRLVYNQPAGHLELNETLIEAARRETLEETGWQVEIEKLLGIYQYSSEDNGITYIRHCFIASAIDPCTELPLDEDIEEALWLTLDELEQCSAEMRSPLVLATIRDYLSGISHSLDAIVTPGASNQDS